MRLRDVGSKKFNWSDLRDFVWESPNDSALFRALHPDDYQWASHESMLLAQACDTLAILAWQKTPDGKKNRNQPQPIPRPGVEQQKRRVRGGSIPVDQFQDRLKRMQKLASVSTKEPKTRVVKRKT